jgi:hypothetical protein
MMLITKAKIRRTNRYTKIDALVDGEWQKSFVFYAGNTREHEGAALQYLVSDVRVPLQNISLIDERQLAIAS